MVNDATQDVNSRTVVLDRVRQMRGRREFFNRGD